MSNNTYSFGQRIFRALFTALVGGAVGLLLALVLIRSGWIRNWNPILLFASVGTALGALTGFWFSDSHGSEPFVYCCPSVIGRDAA